MAACNFVEELSKLRKSSKNSIDNTESFDEFKKYIHVTREIEKNLKELLQVIKDSEKKSLVLLCGSAGDGKSHLLSYLKNNDADNLLEDYVIYNDGTESSSPNKTALDTLNDLLIDYSDEKLKQNIEPAHSVILAINLGVLNNFIDSKYGERYEMLKQFILDKKILTSDINEKVVSDNPHFQAISFSDYHLFNLTENGANVVFLDSMMDKVFNDSSDNPFYSSYKNHCCKSCAQAQYCSVKHNYEFMGMKKCQKYVTDVLVECIIKYKLILTTREFQDFLYNIIVLNDFDPVVTCASSNIKKRISAYLNALTPSLMFEQKDASPLLNIIKKCDPVAVRDEKSDLEAIDFYVSSNVEKSIQVSYEKLPFSNFFLEHQVIEKLKTDKYYRSGLFKLNKRCQSFVSDKLNDSNYSQFLRYLYYYNTNDFHKMDQLYSLVEKATKQWCGTDDDDNLCTESNELGYSLYEEVNFETYEEQSKKKIEETELSRFSNTIRVQFESKNSEEPISLVIDYSLFDLLVKLSNGYIQTIEDRNNHADYLTFIKKIENNGSYAKKVIIACPDGTKIQLQKKGYGFKYKIKGD